MYLRRSSGAGEMWSVPRRPCTPVPSTRFHDTVPLTRPRDASRVLLSSGGGEWMWGNDRVFSCCCWGRRWRQAATCREVRAQEAMTREVVQAYARPFTAADASAQAYRRGEQRRRADVAQQVGVTQYIRWLNGLPLTLPSREVRVPADRAAYYAYGATRDRGQTLRRVRTLAVPAGRYLGVFFRPTRASKCGPTASSNRAESLGVASDLPPVRVPSAPIRPVRVRISRADRRRSAGGGSRLPACRSTDR